MKFKKLVILHCIIIIIIMNGTAFPSGLYDLILSEKIIKGEPCNNETAEPEFYFLPPIEDKDFFESIDDLSITRNKHVRKYIYSYLTEGRKYLINAIARSKRYLDIIKEIFDENQDIPEDISLLPILESGYNPYAVSKSKAVGLWQLLKGTAKALGLKRNKWVDERRDIEKSTKAAIMHLRNLYNIFQSWELALTAYNGGTTHVKRTMNKTKSNGFKELIESGGLKRETSEFVYRFAALAAIYNNQKLFDIESDIPETDIPETENIVLKYPVNIRDISKLTNVSLEILRKYNPELKKSITPPYEKKYTIRIPKGLKEKIETNKSKLYAVKYNKLYKHVVKKGECISKIAEFYNTDMYKIIQLNNIKNPHLIRTGLELFIPI